MTIALIISMILERKTDTMQAYLFCTIPRKNNTGRRTGIFRIEQRRIPLGGRE